MIRMTKEILKKVNRLDELISEASEITSNLRMELVKDVTKEES